MDPAAGWQVPAHGARTPSRLQIDYYCRLDCLWKKKFKKEREEFETMESVNRLLLENVLPAHVAAHFIGDKLNEVRPRRAAVAPGGRAESHHVLPVVRASQWGLWTVGAARAGTRAWAPTWAPPSRAVAHGACQAGCGM